MIKDLKAKVEGLENAMAMAQREGVVPTTPAHQHGAHSSVQAAPGLGSPSANLPVADLSTMPAAELRTR